MGSKHAGVSAHIRLPASSLLRDRIPMQDSVTVYAGNDPILHVSQLAKHRLPLHLEAGQYASSPETITEFLARNPSLAP